MKPFWNILEAFLWRRVASLYNLVVARKQQFFAAFEFLCRKNVAVQPTAFIHLWTFIVIYLCRCHPRQYYITPVSTLTLPLAFSYSCLFSAPSTVTVPVTVLLILLRPPHIDVDAAALWGNGHVNSPSSCPPINFQIRPKTTLLS